MEEYVNGQPILNVILNKIVSNNLLVQAYLLVGGDEKQLYDSSILLAKTLICPKKYKNNCKECNICMRINNNEYGELKIIEPINNSIKKEEIIDLRDEFQTNSIEGKNRVYIVENAQFLGDSAANSILKFLEEPSSNTVGIFTTTDLSFVKKTIISRCQILKLQNSSYKNKQFVQNFCECDDELLQKTIVFFESIEKEPKKTIVNVKQEYVDYLNSKEKLTSFFKILLLIYKDKLNYLLFNEYKYFTNDNKISSIKINDKEKIIKKINFILQNIEKIKYNVNSFLFINNLIIGMGEIEND